MNRQQLRALLDEVGSGRVSPESAHERLLQYLRQKPYEDLGFARVDHARNTNQGFPEVVFGQGKTPTQVSAIAARLVAAGQSVLVTRTNAEAFQAVSTELPDAHYHELVSWPRQARQTCRSPKKPA
jgi:NCAIR mutase (PurE)-related protein